MEEKKEFKYNIGSKVFIQRKLVLGQINQLTRYLPEMKIPVDPQPLTIVTVLGPSLPRAFAIVLTEEGKTPQNKDLDVLADEIAFGIDIETSCQVIEDFFVCNPLQFQRESIEKMVAAVMGSLGSKNGVSSSPEGTSQNETGSSGDSPPTSASPT
jgi:hypothetical protein